MGNGWHCTPFLYAVCSVTGGLFFFSFILVRTRDHRLSNGQWDSETSAAPAELRK